MSSSNTPPSCDAKVDALISDYRRPEMQQRYYNLARITMKECEGMLSSLHIKGVVTCRTKDPGSLKEKLLGMAEEPEFCDWVLENKDTCITQYKEMGDLAGVRIGLYLPGDVIKVGKEIQERFVQKHLFGTVTGGRSASQSRNLDIDNHDNGVWVSQDANGSNETWEHSGYKSWQVVVGLKEPLTEGLNELNVEIQIGTVVTQAWAEIQHNIIYKQPGRILATPTMKRMIDGINGLAITTEIMLRELEKGHEQAEKEAEARYREPFASAKEMERWFHKTYLMKLPREERERWVPDVNSASEFRELWRATFFPRNRSRSPPRKLLGSPPPLLCPKNLQILIESRQIMRTEEGTGQLDVFAMLLKKIGYRPGQKHLDNFLYDLKKKNILVIPTQTMGKGTGP